ncbi:N-acetylmannosamine-6-phosphate 2-epimerase [Yinghuangia aomiensis]|uniref:N-acylglucosamine-6-phosphate 2-epimerase n=1 Tax=Yinghuangia aomiensis TaxID=676205 RepID=A0ABP9H6M4_9ACTN
MHPLLERLRGGLIVSVQVHRPDDPLRNPDAMARMAGAAVAGGAAAIRCGGIGGPDDVRAISAAVDVPVIGLWKDGREGVYITPTARHVHEVADAGAHIIAIDGTRRPRPDGRSLADSIAAAHDRGLVAMADVGTRGDALAAVAAGADVVATTLSGYTPDSPRSDGGPDLDLVRLLASELPVPVVAEGRYHRPDHAAAAIAAGAYAVVVGTAITSPGWLTGQFRNALPALPAAALVRDADRTEADA